MNVISTVRSRCQEWSIYYKEDLGNNYTDENIAIFKEFIENVCGKDDAFIYNQLNMKNRFADRVEWSQFFTEILYYLTDVYNDKVELGNNLTKEQIVRVLDMLEDILKYLKSNGNIELILDKFVIEMRKILML